MIVQLYIYIFTYNSANLQNTIHCTTKINSYMAYVTDRNVFAATKGKKNPNKGTKIFSDCDTKK